MKTESTGRHFLMRPGGLLGSIPVAAGMPDGSLAMGGMGAMLDKLPGGAAMAGKVSPQFGDKELKRQIAIIDSMTAKERAKPDLLNGSRRRRIAAGSGTQVQEVNRLIKQYDQLADMMKKMSGGGMQKMLRGLKGRMPPGFGPR